MLRQVIPIFSWLAAQGHWIGAFVVSHVDRYVLACLIPLSIAILVCGVDDLLVDLAWGWLWLKAKLMPAARMFPPGPRQLAVAPRAKIAIFVPCWHEDEVIASMLEHNLAAIRYDDYHFFAGCYPNDAKTQAAVNAVAKRFPQVHLAVCPHDGPTSKADCLNWVFQCMLLVEEEMGERFEIVMTHDAEDIIHPEELTWISYYAARFDFVQTPVLALSTPLADLVHGIYCDEFAEYHSRDMPVRAAFGGFVPSCGVGTGYRRDALERLASAYSNRIFEPDALTEDYDNGLRLNRLGCSQAFVPLLTHNTGVPGRDAFAPNRDFVATREFFPRKFGAALKQRTRWTIGISLQSWKKFGWKGTLVEVYWMWRDRKGLIANPLSIAANFLLIYGIATGIWNRTSPEALRLAKVTLLLLSIRTAVRCGCVGRIYGWTFAALVPLRAVYANLLNSLATIQALRRFTHAQIHGLPLKWVKTEHAYPSRATLLDHKRRLGEILVGNGLMSAPEISNALADCPKGVRLGEFLIMTHQLTETQLYESLSFQQGLPLTEIHAEEVPSPVARAFPRHVVREWKVLPFKIEEHSLHVASPEIPSAEMTLALGGFTKLETRFHLVTPAQFRELTAALL